MNGSIGRERPRTHDTVGGWQGLTEAQVEDETTLLVAFIVEFEHDAMTSVTEVTASSSGTVSCTYKARMGSNTLVIYGGQISTCGATMYAMKSGVRLKGPGLRPRLDRGDHQLG